MTDSPLIYHITYAAFNSYGVLFESGKSDPLEFASFDPDEYHILFAQTIMVSGAVVVNSMTGLQVLGFLEGVSECFPGHLAAAPFQRVVNECDRIVGMA